MMTRAELQAAAAANRDRDGLSKGTKVTFAFPETGVETKGIVVKGGKRVEVAVVGDPNSRVRGGARAFVPADFDLPAADPEHSSMDGYEVRKYQEYPRLSDETTAHNATIYLNGKPVVEISNDGHGGCDMIYPAKGCTYVEVDTFQKHVAAWWKECGGNVDPFEPEGVWVSWYVQERPFGVTARRCITKYAEELQELCGHRM